MEGKNNQFQNTMQHKFSIFYTLLAEIELSFLQMLRCCERLNMIYTVKKKKKSYFHLCINFSFFIKKGLKLAI